MYVQELIKRINEYGLLLADERLSDIERDILLEDLRVLYVLAKGSKSTVTLNVNPSIIISDKEEVVLPEKVLEPEVIVSREDKSPSITEKTIQAPLISEQKSPAEESIPVVNLSESTEEPRARPIASINDIFMGEEKSLNDKLSSNSRPALNDQAARKDLKSLIDLNKQFVITNELFKGDGVAFQSAIDCINGCATVEAAFDYIKIDLIPRYQWSGDMQSARLFDKLVRMKFGV